MKYRHDAKEAEAMVQKALRMAGRSLDMTVESTHFKWEDMAESLIVSWKQDNYHYQLMLENERELMRFCQEALVDHVYEILLPE